MDQFILVVMVYVGVMGGQGETYTKQWHVYNDEQRCKIASLNLTFNKASDNKEKIVQVTSEAICERFDPKKHQNFYRGVK